MGILNIKQTLKTGQTKQWKINSKQKMVTFGRSRKAQLTSIDETHSAFQAAVEYQNGQWNFIQFEALTKFPQMTIKNNFELEIGKSILKFEVIDKQRFVSDALNHTQVNGTLQKKIILVHRGQQLLKTDILDKNQDFYYNINGDLQKIDFNLTTVWDIQNKENYEFKSKLVQIEDLTALNQVSKNQIVDSHGKKLVIATLSSLMLLLTVKLVSPQNENIVTVPAPMSAQNIVIKMEKKKEKIQKSQGLVSPTKAVAAQKQDPNPKQASAASSNKVSALLKGAVGARISQLMGKVSATDARTANIIATAQGIKAGEGSSGRALSAAGNVETSGRNWNGEAVGTSTGVSTNGIAGGRGVASLGSGLSAGKTGKGGIGLLEDDSVVEGGLDRDIIAQYIKSQLGKLLSCYDRQLAVNKELGGKVSVKFIISGTGQVVQQNITETEMKNLPTESCMLSHISKWKFPEPKGGTKVVVTYPFLFNTK